MLKPDDHVLDYVDPYLHDVLSASEGALLERHCEACPICQVALEEGRKRLAAMQSVPVIEASERLIRATEERIAAHRQTRWTPRRVGLAFAAAIVLFLGVTHLYYLNLTPSPYDLMVLGQTELLAGTEGSLRVVVVRHGDQSPVVGVPVKIELAQRNSGPVVKLASFHTDQAGTSQAGFRWPDWEPGEYELRVHARPAGSSESITRTVKLKRSWQLMVSSDKPLYQPGQTIHLRSLALRRPDLKPVAGHDVSFSIADPKGNVIFHKPGVTSRFGIASADCPLADEIIEGAYQVTCQVGDTHSELTVEVQRYVLPKFKISVAFDKPYYLPGERVSGKVEAHYFFGKPVEKGPVEIAVDLGVLPGDRLKTLNAMTDAKGVAAFEFVLPQRLPTRDMEGEEARISVSTTIRDGGGQEQKKSESCVVAAQPIHIAVIPEGGTLVAGVPNRVYLLTTYPDGRPAQVRIAITGERQEVETDELGVATVDVTPTTNHLTWTLHAVDNDGREGRRTITLDANGPLNDFLIQTDQAVYAGGQTLHLAALGKTGKEPVFVDFIKDGQTMLTRMLEMKEGHGECEFDLPAELFGTIELCAYRYTADGLPLRKRRVLYIRQANEIRIAVAQNRPEYRPGETARLQLKLTDGQGRAVPGAISLAAVDEAVYSVLDQAPGMERRFFTLEQELLKPVLAAYAWSPDLLSDAPAERRARLERALFARTPESDGKQRDALVRKNLMKPPEVAAQLRAAMGPHSLSVSSYPMKLQDNEARKSRSLARVKTAWLAFAVIGFVIVVALAFRRFWQGVLAVASIFVLGTLLLPAIGRSRLSVDAMAITDTFFGGGTTGKKAKSAAKREAMGMDKSADSDEIESARLRQWFPETLLWRPELITDDNGQVSLDVALADSITTWRLSASAVSANGELGALQESVRVFQPFFVDLNLPVALTLGDTVTVPVVVYNYLDRPQTVTLALENAEAFERLDGAEQSVELAAGEVKSVGYRLRTRRVGKQTLRVTARAGEVGDTVERPVEVIPNGRRVEQIANGTLQELATISVAVPDVAIEGSVKGILKIYPSSFSQLVEGLDAIFQRPYGCFEQTSSTTYPNILALDYLRRTKKSAPDVEAKARAYIHLGYQRLLTFEIDGGGFDWFGNPPANRVLSAYGLMEFADMARVHDVDPALIQRTRNWLVAQQKPDGSWDPEGHLLHEDPTGGSGKLARLATTAYIAAAVFSHDAGNATRGSAMSTLAFLVSHEPASIEDPYVLALVASAATVIDGFGKTARPYLERLETLKQTSADHKLAWWGGARPDRTLFYGGGVSGQIETTALAALAMMTAGNEHTGTVRGALAWLVQQRDPGGTWHSTQATVLALKTLTMAAERPMGGDRERQIDVLVDGKPFRKLTIPSDQSDVMQQVDLSAALGPGNHDVVLTDRSHTAAGYQMAVSYHTLDSAQTPESQSLSVALEFKRFDLTVGDTVEALAIVKNDGQQTVPMVMVDLPIPPGFEVDQSAIKRLVSAGKIEKFQMTPRSVIVYLRSLAGSSRLEIAYSLRATMVVKVTSPPAVAYEYYTPERKAISGTFVLTVAQ